MLLPKSIEKYKCRNCKKIKKSLVICDVCKKEFLKFDKHIIITKNNYCSNFCRNKSGKSYGCKRSKFEIYVEGKLIEKFPNLNFIFNDRIALKNLELDIFIPDYKLGIEINGPHHSKNIYGENMLKRMQIRDKYKRKLCYAEKIELFILDISNLKSTKEENKFIYYKEIENFILNKIG